MDDFLNKIYRLKKYPFDKDIPDDALLEYAWVNRDKELNSIFDLIQKSEQSRKNSIIVVIGDHGMGKSSTLIKVTKDATKKGIYSVFTNLRSAQRIKNPGLDVIFKIFKSVKFEDFKINTNMVDELNCDNDVKNLYKAIFFDNNEINRNTARAYLKGEIKLTQPELRKLEIVRKLDDIDILKEYLEGFLILIKNAGYPTLLVCIDEFEYLFGLVPRKDQPIYLALFRDLYDMPSINQSIEAGNSANMVFIWGVSFDGWTRYEELSGGISKNQSVDAAGAALMRRIKHNKIKLNPFGIEETKEMIKRRLSMERTTGKTRDSPLIPYTENFVNFIFKEAGGRLDKIILYCEVCLEAGLIKQMKEIDEEFAKVALKENGYIISNEKLKTASLFDDF